ncbi:MAG: hypothetical protein E7564_01025 [Ruminococcaceae bacterium]|nr:hypothetical protein [Oscillospiraceae bacterium]
MSTTKKEIRAKLEATAERNKALTNKLTDSCLLTDYRHLVKEGNIWTKALQEALNDHEIVIIPASDFPYMIDNYMIDNSVTIPSNRRSRSYTS